jgi:Electron transfer DM13
VIAWLRTHRAAAAAIAVVGIALLAGGVYWFAPQRLVLDRTVSETLPTTSASADPSGGADRDGDDGQGTTGPPLVELASGSFRSLEHATSGVAKLVELGDGSRFVRLEDLETSDGPDLRVYLTDQPLSDDWHVWDDGIVVDVGALKGNVGDSNYSIPDGVDITGLRTVVIWCRRFTVGFGVAPI